jgi:hypothetical protein
MAKVRIIFDLLTYVCTNAGLRMYVFIYVCRRVYMWVGRKEGVRSRAYLLLRPNSEIYIELRLARIKQRTWNRI